ncbi:MAG TPA: YfcC family protein, partial [Bacteroidetes bacterium]|nr:YfcC family protein [Bacteroidota bacterium]
AFFAILALAALSVAMGGPLARWMYFGVPKLGQAGGFTRILSVFTFAAAMGLLVVGVIRFHWYIEEIAALFLGTGILVGILGGLRGSEISSAFNDGAKELVNTALIIGLARGILLLARDGKIIDTILHGLSGLIRGVHPVIASQAMFALQTCINFFVPSGSGQAALTMPIMAPLADLLGVSRQIAVLAFQFGDGFTNLIIPTSAVCMGILAVAKVPWQTWARWMLPLQAMLFLLGLLLLIPPFLMGWK